MPAWERLPEMLPLPEVEAFEAYEATFPPPKQKLRLPGQLGYEE